MSKPIMIATALAITLGLGVQEAQAKRGDDDRRGVAFEVLDADSDGKVTQAEIDAHRAKMFAERDTNSDGKLSAEELTAKAEERHEKRVNRMIERLDADKDGALSMEEMTAARKEGRGGLMRMDEDGDGAISKAEFDAKAGKMKRGGKGHKGQKQN